MDTGLVEQHLETKKYRLGLGLVRLAGTKLAQLDVVTASAGPMKELLNKTGETISLAVLYGDELVYLARMESLMTVFSQTLPTRHHNMPLTSKTMRANAQIERVRELGLNPHWDNFPKRTRR
jgi:DNA-binding IclR family transcriptional regulator